MKTLNTIILSSLLFICNNLFADTYNIAFINGIAGWGYVPSTLSANVGDTINISANTSHPLIQVDSSTWQANGTTPLNGGWGTKTTDYSFVITQAEDIYYVCQFHVSSMNMKGMISVSANPPVVNICDSIMIDSLRFSNNIPNAISLSAKTTILNLCVSYPGFILFNNNGDTIAKENVNYFCLGFNTYQTHLLQIINNPVLPMNGYIELHEGFYDSLVCSFNVTLNDTLLTNIKERHNNDIKIYPNPGKDIIYFDSRGSEGEKSIEIFNIQGKLVFSSKLSSKLLSVKASLIGVAGNYLVKIFDLNNKATETRQLVLQ